MATISNPTYLPPTASFDAMIAATQSLSGVVDLGQNRLWGIVMPGAWTAASMTFQGSVDGVSFFDLYDDVATPGTFVETTWTVAAAQMLVPAVPVRFIGIRWLKIRSGTSAAPVAQAAGRVITIIGVP
jgi:hypothetical protein